MQMGALEARKKQLLKLKDDEAKLMVNTITIL